MCNRETSSEVEAWEKQLARIKQITKESTEETREQWQDCETLLDLAVKYKQVPEGFLQVFKLVAESYFNNLHTELSKGDIYKAEQVLKVASDFLGAFLYVRNDGLVGTLIRLGHAHDSKTILNIINMANEDPGNTRAFLTTFQDVVMNWAINGNVNDAYLKRIQETAQTMIYRISHVRSELRKDPNLYHQDK